MPPHWGTLLRSVEEPRLFYSFGPWPSMETIAAMRAHPDAPAALAKLTALCETAETGTFFVAATAGLPTGAVRHPPGAPTVRPYQKRSFLRQPGDTTDVDVAVLKLAAPGQRKHITRSRPCQWASGRR
jgi:hypothetical protein